MCLQEIVEVVINQCLELKEVTYGELFGYCLFFCCSFIHGQVVLEKNTGFSPCCSESFFPSANDSCSLAQVLGRWQHLYCPASFGCQVWMGSQVQPSGWWRGMDYSWPCCPHLPQRSERKAAC